jgi:hypothetical protein
VKVLFVTYGGGHIEMCLPVIKALRECAPASEILLMALTTAHAAARRAGEAPLGYRDFCRLPDDARAFEYGELLLPGNEHPDVSREESVAYLGQNFVEWIDELGLQTAFERWRAVGRQGFLPFRFFRRVLGKLQPDVVVTTNSPRSEEAAVIAAAGLGIPTLSMLDLFAMPGDPFALRSVAADRITVLSEVAAENLVNAGVPPERIFVTGNPAFDELAGPQAAAQGLEWRRARGWDGKNIVLWAGHLEPLDAESQWAGSSLGRAVQERLVQWVSSREDVCLAVRYHPNEWHGFEPPPPHPRIHWSEPGRESLLPVLMAADQVVVQATTVGVQAYTAGKLVVALGFSPLVRRTRMDYANLGMARRADSLDELVELLAQGVQRASAPPPAGAGRAASAVANHIVALATQNVKA